MRPGWITEVRARGVEGVAQAIGMARRGRGWGPCPACQAERRSDHDGRPPVGSGDGVGWRCHACGAGGDPADLASWRAIGRSLSEAAPDDRAAVRAECARLGLCAGDDRPPERMVGRSARPAQRGGARALRRPTAGEAAPVEGRADAPDEAAEPARPPEAPDVPWWDGPLRWDAGLPDRCVARLWGDPEAAPVREYLCGEAGRRLPESAVRAFRLGAHRDGDGWWWVAIPLLDERGDDVNVKFRRVPRADGGCDRPKYRACAGRPMPLFGRATLSADLGHVLVVEGELDVVAAWAYGLTRDVVSGTAGAGTWSDDWTDALEHHQTVALALDPDEAGEAGVALLQERLGRHRCERVTLPHKDLSECWQRRVDLSAIELAVSRARPLVGLVVQGVGAYRERLRAARRDPHALVGPSTGVPELDDLFGGWPYGLTVITGPSGGGKTSFAAWCAREHARAGGTPLVTGLEQQPIGVVHKLVRQELGRDLWSASDADVDAAVDRLEASGIRVVDHYGRVGVDDVIETARYWRRRHGIEWVLVDHLGYLIPPGSDDRVSAIDVAVQSLALSGAQDRICYVLIAHPDKASRQLERPTVQTLRGSASIDQEASLGLCVMPARSGRARAVVHCDKQRGEWGHGAGHRVELYYGVVSGLYSARYDRLPVVDRAEHQGRSEPEPEDDAQVRASGGERE